MIWVRVLAVLAAALAIFTVLILPPASGGGWWVDPGSRWWWQSVAIAAVMYGGLVYLVGGGLVLLVRWALGTEGADGPNSEGTIELTPLRTWARLLFASGGGVMVVGLVILAYDGVVSGGNPPPLIRVGLAFAAAFGVYRGYEGRRVARWFMSIGAVLLATWVTAPWLDGSFSAVIAIGCLATLIGDRFMGMAPRLVKVQPTRVIASEVTR